MKFREFLDLTDEEVIFILNDIFKPVRIENIKRNAEWQEITAEITTDGWDDGESVYETTDEITLTLQGMQVDFSIDCEDNLKYKKFLLAKGCDWRLKDNPYIKEPKNEETTLVKCGKWIAFEEYLQLSIGRVKVWESYMCSECGNVESSPTMFCPECGVNTGGEIIYDL